MHWSQIDWGQILRENLPLLIVPVCAALVGLGIGRLIRGRPYIGSHGGCSVDA
ncbi:hypothetical protein SAMN05446935_0366 [Burkholderia sp. YR290]|nr:hypothetical protein SAMN05446935_0366 [Burkholderia sp. YR290]